MARLAAQNAENAALKERQAKLDKDQQVTDLQPGCATDSAEPTALCCLVMPLAAEPMPSCFAWLCRQRQKLCQMRFVWLCRLWQSFCDSASDGLAAGCRTCTNVLHLVVPLMAEPVCLNGWS